MFVQVKIQFCYTYKGDKIHFLRCFFNHYIKKSKTPYTYMYQSSHSHKSKEIFFIFHLHKFFYPREKAPPFHSLRCFLFSSHFPFLLNRTSLSKIHLTLILRSVQHLTGFRIREEYIYGAKRREEGLRR